MNSLEIVCSECAAVNRVPVLKSHDKPVCGKCRTRLLPAHPVELNDSSFAKFIARNKVPVLVDFWAPWCGPCRMMAPEFHDAAAQLSPSVILAKLNTESDPRTAAQFGISGIPTLILFKDGIEVHRQSGVMNAQQIARFVGGR